MTMWYKADGVLRLRDCPEVHALVAELDDTWGDEWGSLDADGCEPGETKLFVHFGGEVTAGGEGADELDNDLKKFLPYLVEPTLVATDLEDQKNDLYLGPPERLAETIGKKALDEAKDGAPYMLPQQRRELVAWLNRRLDLPVADAEGIPDAWGEIG